MEENIPNIENKLKNIDDIINNSEEINNINNNLEEINNNYSNNSEKINNDISDDIDTTDDTDDDKYILKDKKLEGLVKKYNKIKIELPNNKKILNVKKRSKKLYKYDKKLQKLKKKFMELKKTDNEKNSIINKYVEKIKKIQKHIQNNEVELINGNLNSNPTFGKLIEALYNAGIKAQENAQISHLQIFKQYFTDLDNDGIYEPKIIKVRVPNSDEIVKIPLFSLIHHNTLKIDNLNIKLKIKLNKLVEDLTHYKIKNGNNIKNEYKKTWNINIDDTLTLYKKQYVDVNVNLKYEDPTECIIKLMNKYNRSI